MTPTRIDISDMVPSIEAAGARGFREGLSTAWVPYKATWQGASTGEGEMRDAWLRGWKREAQAQADAGQAAAMVAA